MRQYFGRLNLTCVSLAALCVLAWSAPAAADQGGQIADSVERTFSIAARPAVMIKNVDGRTLVSAGAQQSVQVRAVKEVFRAKSREEAQRAAAEVHVRIEQIASRIEVETVYPKNWFPFGTRPSVEVHIEVTMPASGDLEARSIDGPMHVEGINGRIVVSTVDGDLTVRRCTGNIEARSVDGRLLLEDSGETVKARTVDGNITITGLLKNLEVSTTDGDLDITIEDGSRIEAEWEIRSTDGDIVLRMPEGFSADLDIQTGDGRITNQHAVVISGDVSGRRLKGRMNSGGGLLQIRTSDGDVAISKR